MRKQTLRAIADIMAAIRAAEPELPKPPKGARSAREWADEWGMSVSQFNNIYRRALKVGRVKVFARHDADAAGRKRRIPVYLFAAK